MRIYCFMLYCLVAGQKLNLFTIHSEAAGGGLVFWMPKGSVVRRLIEDYWKDEHVKVGALVYWMVTKRSNSNKLYPTVRRTATNWSILPMWAVWTCGAPRVTATTTRRTCSPP